jgi:acetyl esterase/lipase
VESNKRFVRPGLKFLLLPFLSLLFQVSTGQTEINLWTDSAPGALGNQSIDVPTLTSYLVENEMAAGSAIMICPGGGYASLAMDHEGKQIAAWLNSIGVHAFILKYRLGNWEGTGYKHPTMIDDAKRAFRIIRYHAKDWNIDPNKLGVMGFSAGGHLASTLGTHFDDGDPNASDPIDRVSCVPNFLILGYPVISFKEWYTHSGSRRFLLGPTPKIEDIQALSNETQVTSLTPPTFLFHTNEDKGVPAENSVAFYLALRKAGVPAEIHIYEKGPHGVGLAPDDPVLSTWKDRLKDWLKNRGAL